MKNLGLPLEYQTLPQFFDGDDENNSGDWQANQVNHLIDKILSENNVHSVIDMTCGTGSQVFYLNSKNYTVIGSDFSLELIEIARNKAKNLQKNIEFIYGDMRNIEAGKFDAIITIFNAVGHISKEDFLKTMKNINGNLNNGGIYLFDIFNLEALNDDILKTFPYQRHVKVRNCQMLKSKCSTLDRENSLLISYDHVMVQQDNGKPDLYENVFSLRIYTIDELEEMLSNAGFKVLSVCGIDGSEFARHKTTSMLVTAKKI